MEFHRVPFEVSSVVGSTAVTVTTYNTNITGRVYCIYYDYGDADTGMKIVVTGATTGVPIFTLDGTGTADVTWYPGERGHDADDGGVAAETDENRMPPVFGEGIQIAVTEATAGEVGTFYIGIVD